MVFTDEEVKVGCTNWLEMEIRIKEDAHQGQAPEYTQKDNLRAQLDSWLKDGVISPAESLWGLPLFPVAKKHGDTRWAVDF